MMSTAKSVWVTNAAYSLILYSLLHFVFDFIAKAHYIYIIDLIIIIFVIRAIKEVLTYKKKSYNKLLKVILFLGALNVCSVILNVFKHGTLFRLIEYIVYLFYFIILYIFFARPNIKGQFKH